MFATIVRDVRWAFRHAARRPLVAAAIVGTLTLGIAANAAFGVYGVLSMLVASRTREIGVRLALGASPRVIAGSVVRESVWRTAPGLVAGSGLAIAAGRLLESLLVGVSSSDPLTVVLVTATTLSAAVLAALVPAVRAARVDPVVALRGE